MDWHFKSVCASSFLRFDTGLEQECTHMDEKRKSDVAELRELKNLYLGMISFEVLKVKKSNKCQIDSYR